MPRIFDSGSRADLQAWKIAMLLAEEGAKALTIRRISDVCRLSTSSLMNHWGNKERLLRVAMFRNTRWRLDEIQGRRYKEGVAAFIPRDDLLPHGRQHDSMVLARAWLGWRELWRVEPGLVMAGYKARGEERWLLGGALEERASEGQLDAAYALLEGLVVAVCAPMGSIPRDRAVALFAEQLEVLVGPGNPQAS